jgi:hypothetical protein
MLFQPLLLHQRLGVNDGTVDSGDGHDFEPLLEGFDDILELLLVLLLVRVDHH